jgi:hypothetical protein
MPTTELMPPDYRRSAFDCPHCRVYSTNFRSGFCLTRKSHEYGSLIVVVCENCLESSVWYDNELIYPVVPEASLSEGK